LSFSLPLFLGSRQLFLLDGLTSSRYLLSGFLLLGFLEQAGLQLLGKLGTRRSGFR
jgi:hypothetical protein